ncbi:MAG: hypothetical protein CFE43_19665 [Burkholderiales bacterium PBB3]|nr:MAG: hypothetical protein CFE43_19665 [Burkholderiales bacterium PBB3]
MKKFMLRRLGVAHEGTTDRPTLQSCLEAVLGQSDALVDDMLAGLQASVGPAKPKTHQGTPNALAQSAIATLIERGADLKVSFAESLRSAVYGGETHRNRVNPSVKFDDFQFLDEDQLDANIEFALTQQEVILAVDDSLPLLNGLVSSLMGWVTVQGALNPLKPEVFIFALRESVASQVADEGARAAVITQAAGALGVSLRMLYRELSEWLRSQGVEPVGTLAPIGGGIGSYVKPAESSVTRTMLTLDKLRRLFSGELDPGPQGGVKDFMHTVPASFVALEDMKLVEPMMKRLVDRASQPSQAPGRLELSPGDAKAIRRDRTHSKRLGRQLGEEVVRMMLENLMQDRRLMPKIRQSLKSLEPVLIKLSQRDPRFFSERQHPARQFMDRITSRSLAFPQEEDPRFVRFHKALENSVSVLDGGEGDAASFTRVLRKLEEGWAKDEQDQRHRAEEAARALLHAEQRNLLAERMAADFAERVKDKKIPDMVINFLQGPWAQVVAESQLQCVDGTVDNGGYLSLVDDLIWSVQLKLARRNRAKLVSMVPGMLVIMRQGLQLISYPEERIPVFFDALITFHEKAFELVKPNDAPAIPLASAADEGISAALAPDESANGADGLMPADALWMADDEATDSGYLQASDSRLPDTEEVAVPADTGIEQSWTAHSLVTGSWVDLALAGQWVRAQLTWASPHRTLFMFISGSGMAHSMSRRTMDRLKEKGLIRFVSDGRVLDNALDAVAQAALRSR